MLLPPNVVIDQTTTWGPSSVWDTYTNGFNYNVENYYILPIFKDLATLLQKENITLTGTMLLDYCAWVVINNSTINTETFTNFFKEQHNKEFNVKLLEVVDE